MPKERANSQDTPKSAKRAKTLKTPRNTERDEALDPLEIDDALFEIHDFKAEEQETPTAVKRIEANDHKSNLKTMVRGAYDEQSLRIMTGNRIVANFKAKLGQTPGKTEEETLEDDAKRILLNLRQSYALLTDGVVNFPSPKAFKGDELISSYTELCLVAQYLDLARAEKTHFRRLGHVLMEYPIYTEYLMGVTGIGPAMAGVIISEIDIRKAKYPSSLWKYAGLDVGADGKGRSRKEEHLVKVQYTAKDGTQKERNSITYNPFLKTKLMGVLSGSFLRSGNERYCEIYAQYKQRLEHHAVYGLHNDEARIAEAKAKGKKYAPKGHRDQMAKHYMVKMFLADLYNAWRPLEGLPVAPTYAEAKLGYTHGQQDRAVGF